VSSKQFVAPLNPQITLQRFTKKAFTERFSQGETSAKAECA